MSKWLLLACCLATSLLSPKPTGFGVRLQDASNGSAQQLRPESELDKAIAERDRLMQAQKFAEALPVAQRVVEILRKEKPNSLELARALDALGRPMYFRGDLPGAEMAWTEALAILEKLVPGSLNVAASLNNLGLVARARGDMELSQRRYEAALAIREKLAPASLHVAASLGNLGNVAADRGDLDLAQRRHEAALALFEKLAPASPEVAMSLGNLGAVAADRGDLDLAQRRYEAVLALLEKLAPGSLDVADSLSNLGNVARDRGDLDLAQRRYEAAFALYEKLAPGSLDVAFSLNSLGTVAFKCGDLDLAQRRYEAALAIRENLASGSLEVAVSLNNLGLVALGRGDLNLALRRYESALAIQEKLAPGSPDVAASLGNLGGIAWSRGDLELAQKRFESAHAIQEKLAPCSLAVAASLNNLGAVASARKDLQLAQRRHESALAIQERLAPGSLALADILSNLGDVARMRGDQAAFAALSGRSLDLAAALLTNQGASRAGELGSLGAETNDALKRLGWLESPQSFYLWLPTLRAAGLTLQSRAKIGERAAEGDERVRKARSAVQIAAKQETDWVTNPRPKVMTEEEWNDRLLDLRAKGQSAELALATLLKAKDPRLAADLKVKLGDVQRNIPKDAALVEYLRISTWDEKAKKRGPDAYGAFIVRNKGEVKFVHLGNAEEIGELVREFMSRVNVDLPSDRADTTSPPPPLAARKSRTQLGKELYRRLVTPLGTLPANLQVAPDASLHGLAFDALQDSRGRYLLQRFSVSLVGSGRDLAVRPPSAPASRPAVFGVSRFDADLAAQGRAARAVRVAEFNLGSPSKVSRGNRGGSSWRSLPGAEAEAREVASLLRVDPILNSQAIEERLLSTKNPRVLHLATHGFSFPPAFEAPKGGRMETTSLGERFGSSDNPMLRSGIVLAGANDEAKLAAAGYQDGWVTALELSLMDLRGTELVVLSACDTGLGDVRQSEGVFGLQRAIRFAGARTMVMSLFEVPDASTKQLMAAFYRSWKPGDPTGAKQAALRAAKLKLLRNPATRSPKNWAAFVLLGDR